MNIAFSNHYFNVYERFGCQCLDGHEILSKLFYSYQHDHKPMWIALDESKIKPSMLTLTHFFECVRGLKRLYTPVEDLNYFLNHFAARVHYFLSGGVVTVVECWRMKTETKKPAAEPKEQNVFPAESVGEMGYFFKGLFNVGGLGMSHE